MRLSVRFTPRILESGWFLAGTVATRAFNFLTSFALARLLGPEGFGQIALVQATVAVFTSLAGGTLGPTATRHVAELRHARKEQAGRLISLLITAGLIVGLVASAALVIGGPYIAHRELNDARLAILFQAVAVNPLAFTICTVAAGVTAGLNAFNTRARTESIVAASNFAILASAAFTGNVTVVAFSISAFGLLAATFWMRSAVRASACAGIRVGWRPGWEEWRALRDTGFPVFVSGASMSCAMWVTNMALAREGSGYHQVAIYNALAPWAQIINLVPASIVGTFAPKIPGILTDANRSSANIKLASHLLMSVGAAIVAAIPLVLLGDWVGALYGHGFSDTGDVMRNICVFAVLMVAVSAMSQIFYAMNRSWFALAGSLAWCAALVGGVTSLGERTAANVAAVQILAWGSNAVILATSLWVFRRSR